MATRILRNRKKVTDHTAEIEALMKSISKAQEAVSVNELTIKTDTAALYDLMKAQKLTVHNAGPISAMLYRPAGRSTSTIDPIGFRKLVKDDKEFYSCVSISVTKAKTIVPEKQLATIITVTPATPGAETVKVGTQLRS